VHSDGGYRAAAMTVLEPDSGVADLGLKIEPEFTDGTGHLMIYNPTVFTQKLEKDYKLELCKMLKKFFHPPGEVTTDTEEGSVIKRVSTDSERRDKVCKMFQGNLQLSEPEEFCRMLMDHQVFSNEQGEADLVQLEIDSGDA